MEKSIKSEFCSNCQGDNAKTDHVEDWEGICPDKRRFKELSEKIGIKAEW